MRTFTVALLAGALGAAGCGSSTSPDSAPTIASPSPTATTEHDMKAMGHDHGATDQPPAAAGDDRGLSLLSNGDMAHDYGADQPLDAATRAQLVHQLSLTTTLMEQYPTLGDIRAAGSRASGPFEPGMGLHMNLPGARPVGEADRMITDDEVLHPFSLLYDGTGDSAPLAGFMYYAFTDREPQGFAGPNDHWHVHNNICIKQGPDGLEAISEAVDRNREACTEAGGMFLDQSNWMVHVWTVPGYESNRGVFSDINPSIACPDGTYYRTPAKDALTFVRNRCRDAAE